MSHLLTGIFFVYHTSDVGHVWRPAMMTLCGVTIKLHDISTTTLQPESGTTIHTQVTCADCKRVHSENQVMSDARLMAQST